MNSTAVNIAHPLVRRVLMSDEELKSPKSIVCYVIFGILVLLCCCWRAKCKRDEDVDDMAYWIEVRNEAERRVANRD